MSKPNYNYQDRRFYNELPAFRTWLQEQHYAPDTIRQFSNYAGCFLDWLEHESLVVEQVRYAHLLDFIDYYRKEDSIGLLNRKLRTIRKYYEWLQYQEVSEHNPATGIILKGSKSNVPHDLLDRAALDQLYQSYPVTDQRSERNQVILGLLIYQALTVEELHKLSPEDVHLRFAQLNTPKGCQTKPRVLPLQAHQIIPLQHYIEQTRPSILANIYAHAHNSTGYRSGRRPHKINPTQLEAQLFFSMNGSVKIKSSIYHLIQALQEVNPALRSASHIRQSVIAEWLKNQDVRKVQYLAGHRRIIATERYLAHHLEDLQESLRVHHPLR
jgi:integrase/recombinase XerD